MDLTEALFNLREALLNAGAKEMPTLVFEIGDFGRITDALPAEVFPRSTYGAIKMLGFTISTGGRMLERA